MGVYEVRHGATHGAWPSTEVDTGVEARVKLKWTMMETGLRPICVCMKAHVCGVVYMHMLGLLHDP